MKCFNPLLVLLVLAAGCIPSLHPIYNDKDVVFDEALLGKWEYVDPMGEKETWQFTKGEKNSYIFEHTDEKGNRGKFAAHLVKLGDATFLDIQPIRLNKEEKNKVNLLHAIYTLPTHGFFLVDSLKPDLSLRLMEPEWLDKHLEKNPEAIAHEKVDDRIVITAGTMPVQSFIVEHIETPEAYGEPSALKRVEE